MGQHTPGYVDVPGKGRRYRDENGKYYHNHLGVPLTQIGNLFGNPGFGRTSEQHVIGDDGSIGGRVKPTKRSEPKPAAPPQAAEPPATPAYRSRRQGLDATYPDRAPSGGSVVSVGSGGTGGSETRESVTGMVQKGMTLGGINTFLEGMGLRSMTDLKDAYGAPEKNTDMKGFALSDVDVAEGYDASDGAYPGKATAFTQTATTPETTSKPGDMQDGASDKPDLADQIRAVRVNRGARQQEFAERPGNQPERKDPDTSSLVSPMYANEKRNRIRNAFLDMDKGSARAIMDAQAEASYYRDVIGGKDYFNYDGKLVQPKDGMNRKAKNAAMMGESPLEYLDLGESAATPQQEAAQKFKDFYTQEIKAEQTSSEQTNTTIGTPGKPQTVPMSQIPGLNATPEEQEAYLRRLDAGELTGPSTYRK